MKRYILSGVPLTCIVCAALFTLVISPNNVQAKAPRVVFIPSEDCSMRLGEPGEDPHMSIDVGSGKISGTSTSDGQVVAGIYERNPMSNSGAAGEYVIYRGLRVNIWWRVFLQQAFVTLAR